MFWQRNIQKFCDKTTLHGFLELYYSKSIFWKVIWASTLATTIGLSLYQVYNTIKPALDEPTSTLIQQYSGDPTFPPLTICYPLFIYWIDFNILSKLGFDRDSLLYAMTYTMPVISLSPYNVSAAKIKFEQTMKKKRFKNFMDFIDTVSYNTPPGFSYDVNINTWGKFFHPSRGYFCYVATSDTIRNIFNLTTEDDIRLKIYYNQSYFNINTEFISEEEYLLYLKRNFIYHGIINANYTTFTLTPKLGFTGYRESNFILPTDGWKIDVTVTSNVYTWLNTRKMPCNKIRDDIGFDNCKTICKWKEFHRQHPKACLDIQRALIIGENDNTTNICNYPVFTSPESVSNLDCICLQNKEVNFATSSYKSCVESYCRVPCEQWKFNKIISSISMPREVISFRVQLEVSIEYPLSSSIFAMIEVKSQTWETLIGSLGGILGLWLGASVMSILQLVYLLCCSECDERYSALKHNRREACDN